MPSKFQVSPAVRGRPARAQRAIHAGLGLFTAAFVGLQALPAGDPAFGDTPANIKDGSPGLLGTAGTTDCASCHSFEPVLSHPVGVIPSMNVPASLPLDGGRLTCATCHDAPPDHPSARIGVRSATESISLCSQCHTQAEPAGSKAHGRIGTRAHLFSEPGRAKGAATGLDQESRTCISCHDGTAAGDPGIHAVPHEARNTDGTHPIGMLYPRQGDRRGNSDIRLVDLHRLDRRIRLFEQAVGCGSCHSVYSPQPALLVTNNLKSRLCLSCHIE